MKGFLITLVTFLIMEFVAWAVHKYIMHGFLWSLHKDHHVVDKEKVFKRMITFFNFCNTINYFNLFRLR